MNGCMQFGKDRGDIGYALVSCPQPRDWLGERRSENDMMSTYIWKKEAENAEEKASEKDKERKNSRRTSA